MNDISQLLADYIDDADILTDGTEVFGGHYPSEPDSAVAILGLPGTTLGVARDVPALQFPRFQVVTRSATYLTASENMQAVRELLHGKLNVFLPNEDTPTVRLLRIHVDQEGQPIGRDDDGRFEFTMNMIAEYHNV